MENEKYWEDLLSEFERMSDEEFLKTVQEAEEQTSGELQFLQEEAVTDKVVIDKN